MSDKDPLFKILENINFSHLTPVRIKKTVVKRVLSSPLEQHVTKSSEIKGSLTRKL